MDDLANRVAERIADFVAIDDLRARQARRLIAPLDRQRQNFIARIRHPNRALDVFRRSLTDEHVVLVFEVHDDRFVHLIAANANRIRIDDAS